MGKIQSFRDLDVYEMAASESMMIFEMTKKFPSEEKYSLTSQIRRSSRAVNAMLAEAWSRRLYPAAFINKLNEALGEAMETQSWLDHALACGYIDRGVHAERDHAWRQIGGKLYRMQQKSEAFCRPMQEGVASA